MSDPRQHRQVKDVEGNRITYSCRCINEVHPSGVLHSVEKCRGHRKGQRAPETLGRAYYEELGAIIDGVPQCAHYLEELREALGHFPAGIEDDRALEIGPGCSMYAPGLLAAGYVYHGLEPSEWAARWTSSTFDCSVTLGTLEGFADPGPHYALILAAHSLEHVEDAPGAIRKCAGMLEPSGELWIVIPNDDDPLNPDHIWFVNRDTLRSCLEDAGLSVLKIEERQRVKHERFLYARAVKS